MPRLKDVQNNPPRDNKKYAYDFFINKGYSPIHASAIVGNLQQESGVRNNITNSIGAFGIAQWLGGRKKKLMSNYQYPQSLDAQLDFLHKELQSTGDGWLNNKDKNAFFYATDVPTATYLFGKKFERPGDHEANYPQRIKYAQNLHGGSSNTNTQVTNNVVDVSRTATPQTMGEIPQVQVDNPLTPLIPIPEFQQFRSDFSNFMQQQQEQQQRMEVQVKEDAAKAALDERIRERDFLASLISSSSLPFVERKSSDNVMQNGGKTNESFLQNGGIIPSKYRPSTEKSLIEDAYYTDSNFEEQFKNYLVQNKTDKGYSIGQEFNGAKLEYGQDDNGQYISAYNPSYFKNDSNLLSSLGRNKELYTRLYLSEIKPLSQNNALSNFTYTKSKPISQELNSFLSVDPFRNMDIQNIEYNKDSDYSYRDSPKLSLTQGRLNTATIPTKLIDDVYSASKRQGVNPLELLGLIARESTFGNGNDRFGAKQLASGWNVMEDYKSYDPYRFLADNKIPGVTVISDKMGLKYESNPDIIAQYFKENPQVYTDLLNKYKSKVAETPALIKDANYFDYVGRYIKEKGVSQYNPGDSDYTNKINKDIQLLRNEKVLQEYFNKMGYTFR